MQILNISVQNRPQKSLSSRPYVYYILEAVSTDFEMLDATQRTILNSYELQGNLRTDFKMLDVISRDVMVTYKSKPFNVQTDFKMLDAVLLQNDVYTTHKLNPFNIQTNFEMLDTVVVKEVRYLNYSVGSKVQTDFKMLRARLI